MKRVLLTFVMSAALVAGCEHVETEVITSGPCVLEDEHPLCGVRKITIETAKTLPKGVPIHDLDTWDVEISLDGCGRVLEWLVRDPETRKETRRTFEYDADGLLKEYVWYSVRGKPFVTYRFKYDEKRRLAEKTTIDHEAVGFVYKPDLRAVKIPGKGREGLLILERYTISEDGAARFVTEFNELGEKLSERERKPSDSDLQVMNFDYWKLLETYKKREDGPRVETKLSGNDVVYVFSEDGRLSESVEKLARKVGDPTTITRTYSYE